MLSDIIQEFCKQYGLSGISMEEGGSLRLSIDGIGDLQLIQKNSKLVVGLIRKIENPYLLSGRKILACCHFAKSHLKPLPAQLNDDILTFFTIFEENEVTSALLSQTLDFLTDTMDHVL